jgi:hypothetical protein
MKRESLRPRSSGGCHCAGFVLMGSPGVPKHPQPEALRRPLGGPPSGQNPLIKETPVYQEVPVLVGSPV